MSLMRSIQSLKIQITNRVQKCDDCQQAVSYRKVKRGILDSETVKRLRDKWSEIEG